ncbi:MAG: enoyl-CoA hydratase/isomerase family protein [Chitinophagales bacterium]|nr:enoyl-CoA hydratase/isomerase family protein [Chitinophagales bacterium]
MEFQYLLTQLNDSILTITINRPDKLNALNRKVIDELDSVFDEVNYNKEIRGVILTGSGIKAFVAGADISEFSNFTIEQAREMSSNGHRVFNKIEQAVKPVIAAVNGFALGGGCELAMACHIRIASENAKFGQPEINLGTIPGYGGTQRLLRYTGIGKGIEMLLTADTINAETALKCGLVNYVTTQEELLPKCKSILDKIKTKPPRVVTQIIACTNAFSAKNVDGFNFEVNEFSLCADTADFKEGTAAFLEKRPAIFTGK